MTANPISSINNSDYYYVQTDQGLVERKLTLSPHNLFRKFMNEWHEQGKKKFISNEITLRELCEVPEVVNEFFLNVASSLSKEDLETFLGTCYSKLFKETIFEYLATALSPMKINYGRIIYPTELNFKLVDVICKFFGMFEFDEVEEEYFQEMEERGFNKNFIDNYKGRKIERLLSTRGDM